MVKEGSVTEGEYSSHLCCGINQPILSAGCAGPLQQGHKAAGDNCLSRVSKSAKLLSLSKAGQSLPQLPQTPSVPHSCPFFGSKLLLSPMTISHPWFIFLCWSQIPPPPRPTSSNLYSRTQTRAWSLELTSGETMKGCPEEKRGEGQMNELKSTKGTDLPRDSQ